MNGILNWYSIDKRYINYLRKFDSKVQYIDYTDRLKPYLGIIFQISNFSYYVPISSVGKNIQKQNKYSKMKDDIDLFKIYDNHSKLTAVLNLNNMIPISIENIEKLNFKNIDNYRSFKNLNDKKHYIYLLQKELSYLRQNDTNILNRATKLYNEKLKHPNSNISKRTCEFTLLEEKCIEYNRVQTVVSKLEYIKSDSDLYYIYDNLHDKKLFEKMAKRLDIPEMLDNIQNLSKKKLEEMEKRF